LLFDYCDFCGEDNCHGADTASAQYDSASEVEKSSASGTIPFSALRFRNSSPSQVMAKERDKKRLDRLSRFQLMTAPPTTMRQGRDVRRVSYVVTAARARDMDIIDDDLSRKVEDTVQYIDALSNQQFDDELPEVHFNEAAREGYSDQRLDSVIEQFMKAEGYSEELREMLKPDP
jgi:hypothetical protein